MSGDSPYKYKREKVTAGAKRLAEKGDINSGMTKPQERTITSLEAQIRSRKTEKLYAVTEDGKTVAESHTRGQYTAHFDYGTRIPTDAVITHNHPARATGQGIHEDTIANRVGLPLSHADIKAAMNYNAKEVRAVTKTYTYSFRRNGKSWNGNPNDVYNDYAREYNRITNEAIKSGYIKTYKDKILVSSKGDIEHADRYNTVASHAAARYVANKYGFTYTRRRTL